MLRPGRGITCKWSRKYEITERLAQTSNRIEQGKHVLLAILWLPAHPFGNVRGDVLQKEFADQVRHSISTQAREAIDKHQ